MHSTPPPKQADDPHDFVVVPPDVVRVAPEDDELSNLVRDLARSSSDAQTHTQSDFGAATVPPVDTAFRPSAVNDVQVPGRRRSIGRRAARAFTALLLAVCTGVAAIAWQSSGGAAKAMIAKWAPQFVVTSLLPQEKPGLPAPSTPAAVEANAAPPQTAALAQTAPAGVAATAAAQSSESAPSLQSMARDLASVEQEVEQLKASIAQLKASQQQSSSEQNARPRISALPPRPAIPRPRKPIPPFPPTQAAAAPTLPQAAAPYYPPRQLEPQPQAPAQLPAEPGFSSVPRPPMPLR
jgi:hypothetical protein